MAVRRGGAWQPAVKRSEEPAKATLPGIKQVVRCYAGDAATGDLLCLDEEADAAVRTAGVRASGPRPADRARRANGARRCWWRGYREECGWRRGNRWAAIRERAAASLASLPPPVRALRAPAPYPVRRSPALEKLLQDT